MGSDAGEGRVVRTVTVQGQKAEAIAFCYPGNKKEWKNCSVADVSRLGGYLTVTLPAGAGLRETIVEVETDEPGVSAQQLIRIARGLRPVQ